MGRGGRIALCSAIFAVLAWALACRAASAAEILVNSPSQFPIFVDGLFTGAITNGVFTIGNEWADVSTQGFISPASPGGQLFRTPPGTPNSVLYAVLAPGELANDGIQDLYLGYDFATRTDPTFEPPASEGEFIADVAFPIVHPVLGSGDLVVEIRGADAATGTGVNTPEGRRTDSFFDVFFAFTPANGQEVLYINETDLPISADLGFTPTPLSLEPHLFLELEVKLKTPLGFFNTDPQTGGDPRLPTLPLTGVYSPDPAFWGADIANDVSDPPASAAFFDINPNGGLSIDVSFLPQVPEPSSLTLFGLGTLGLLGYRWRRRRRA